MQHAATGFRRLMPRNEEGAALLEEIFEDYIEEKYSTFGHEENIDRPFIIEERGRIRRHLGNRLLTELPPAQGLTVLKGLFL